MSKNDLYSNFSIYIGKCNLLGKFLDSDGHLILKRTKTLMKKKKWRKFGIEFLSIFIAVITAFALNSWNENRRDSLAANKILGEIYNGLGKDIEDIKLNMKGHEDGILACKFWRKILEGQELNLDSLRNHYSSLTRDYISIQNISGYESLKSKGLELIEDDSLRFEIITIYEYDYNIIKKFEEEYNEMQYQKNYFESINNVLAPNFEFDQRGDIIGMKLPLIISGAEKNIVFSYLWKIRMNRQFILGFYSQTEEKLVELRKRIENNLSN